MKIDAARQYSCSSEQMHRNQQSGEADAPGGEEKCSAVPAHAGEVGVNQHSQRSRASELRGGPSHLRVAGVSGHAVGTYRRRHVGSRPIESPAKEARTKPL